MFVCPWKPTPDCRDASDGRAAEGLIAEMTRLVPETGLRNRLSQCGISGDDLDRLVDGTLHQARLLSYNIKTMTRGDILNAFRSIL